MFQKEFDKKNSNTILLTNTIILTVTCILKRKQNKQENEPEANSTAHFTCSQLSMIEIYEN